MMTSLLDRLDEIEQQEPDPSADVEVLELMERIATMPDGLYTLVERYAGSARPIIVRSLSFLLAQNPSSATTETLDLIFSLIYRLQPLDDESTLINCLTAIQRQLIYSRLWPPFSNPSQVLYSFLIYCLEQSVLVQRGAVTVLSRMNKDNLLLSTFDYNQLTSFRHKLEEISSLKHPLLEGETEELLRFLKDV